MPTASTRAGRFVLQPGGFRAFVPSPLPPRPPVRLDAEMTRLLSNADRDLGRLDGVASVLPNPDLFVAAYVRREAVVSSQIEGVRSTIEDVFSYEADPGRSGQPSATRDVVNYVRAMTDGLRLAQEEPVSLDLIRQIHRILLTGARGGQRAPGEFRDRLNWIGQPGCRITEADFVPPPPGAIPRALANLEEFLRQREDLPLLLQAGMAHAQFETIHPFLDGNGRIGRLLITFFLCERGALARPLLYLSAWFRAHQDTYYGKLNSIRTAGDWEGWLKFFLRGVSEVSRDAARTARAILELRERHRGKIATLGRNTGLAARLHDQLFLNPMVTVRHVQHRLGCSFVTAAAVIARLCALGILKAPRGVVRNRMFGYESYLKLFRARPAREIG